MKTSFFCVSGKRRLRQRTDAARGLDYSSFPDFCDHRQFYVIF
jgi:hypothetical protein